MVFKYIWYGLYMTALGLKIFKYWFINMIKGEEAAIKYAFKTTKLWGNFTTKIVGMDVKVIGIENIPNEAVVFMGNHSSILDIAVLLDTIKRDVGFIAKKEMRKVPVFSFWIEKNKSLFLDREDAREGVKIINKGVEQIKEGISMVIFPEGTRGNGGEPAEFKKGSMKLATKAKAPIVPFSISGTYESFEKTRRFTPNKVVINFAKPIYTENMGRDELKELHNKVRETVVEQLKIK